MPYVVTRGMAASSTAGWADSATGPDGTRLREAVLDTLQLMVI